MADTTPCMRGSGSDLVKNSFEGGNRVNLESGNDTYVATGFSKAASLYDIVYAGTGNDTISYQSQDDDADLSGAGVVIDLQAGYADTRGTNYTEKLVSIENAEGTGVSDKIYGSSGANKLWGGAGNDSIYGRNGSDTIFSDSGNDYLSGGNVTTIFMADQATMICLEARAMTSSMAVPVTTI